jgi:hypothetical protein
MNPVSHSPVGPQLTFLLDQAEQLAIKSEEKIRATAKNVLRPRVRRNATIRPGPNTPLWNALVDTVRPHLARHGEKINLGRELGVPPQRIHEYFVARTAAPDAERTLALVVWLARNSPRPTPSKPRG